MIRSVILHRGGQDPTGTFLKPEGIWKESDHRGCGNRLGRCRVSLSGLTGESDEGDWALFGFVVL